MCEEPREGGGGGVQRFLRERLALKVLLPGDTVHSILTGHELPCKLPELKAYTNGKRYLRLIKALEVLDNCSPQLLCKLTLRHISRISARILRRVQDSCCQKAPRRSTKERKCDEEVMKPAMQKGVAKGEKCDPMEVNLQRGTKRAKKQGDQDRKKFKTGIGDPGALREVSGK